MLPRLQALDSIRMANQIAVGTGSLEKETSQSLTRAWERAAQPERAKAPVVTPQNARAIGIGFRRVAKRIL